MLAADRHPSGRKIMLPAGASGGAQGGTGTGSGAGTSPELADPIEAGHRVSPAAIAQAATRAAARYAGDVRAIFERVEALYRG